MPDSVALTRCDTPSGGPYEADPADMPAFDWPNPPAGSVYAAVLKSLELLGLDRAHARTPQWNPFGEFIRPGQQVLIKPNWVSHRNASGADVFSVITHRAVLRPVLDCVLRALEGRGRVILGDAPLQSADFEQILAHSQAAELVRQMRSGSLEIAIHDFRQNVCELDTAGRVVGHRTRAPESGGCTVNLGRRSLLEAVSNHSHRFRVTNYDPSAMRRHHNEGTHEYLIAKAVLESDVVIQVPKLKTHRKACLTCCLKSAVGINASKDYLPHHRMGPADTGGDEYTHRCLWKSLASRLTDRIEASPGGVLARIESLGVRFCRRMARHLAADPYVEGSWYGNDTIWRTVLDLNSVLEYARADGTIADTPQRRLFYVIDAVLAGGGEGPLRPEPVIMGAILAGFTPAAIDACCARLAGLDERKIPLLANALDLTAAKRGKPLAPVLLQNDMPATPLEQIQPIVRLRPPSGWAGHVELQSSSMAAVGDDDNACLAAEE